MPPVRYLLFIFFTLAISTVSSDTPTCNFGDECCWRSANQHDPWTIRTPTSADFGFFRRVFLTPHTVPKGNYVIHTSTDAKSNYVSCPFCSETSQIAVKFRHWQSANSLLRLCWQTEGDASPDPESCIIARHTKQGRANQYKLVVPRGKNVRLVLLAENADPQAEATVVVEKIGVIYDPCTQVSVQQEISASSGEDISKTQKRESKLVYHQGVLKKKLSERHFGSQAYLGGVDRAIAQVVDSPRQIKVELPSREDRPLTRVSISKVQTVGSATTTTAVPPPATSTSPSSGNPLVDLLGDKLVSFLDPNYVTVDDEVDEEDDTVDVETPEVVKPSENVKQVLPPSPEVVQPRQPLAPESVQPRQEVAAPPSISRFITKGKPMITLPQNDLPVPPPTIPLGGPQVCSTPGGCLFEKDFCEWKTPYGIEHKFYLTKVHLSQFVQAVVPSGETAVLETKTSMSEAHTILFDGLEFSLGTRLIGCCASRTSTTCPFTTSADQGPILWQFSKFQCPGGTTSISFLCENYGVSSGICGVDNVRIHRTTDVFFLEPCQKNTLSKS